MTYKIVPPTEGKVTLELSWNDAEVLLRALGWTNSGSLREVSPDLARLCEEMNVVFGRNVSNEANKYLSSVIRGQIYIEEI